MRRLLPLPLMVCLIILLPGLASAQPDDLPTHIVQRADAVMLIDGHLEEACWQEATPVRPFLFPWWTSGDQEQTEARVLWDDENLYVSFIATDQHISASYTERDDPVSRDDAVEVFIAPDPSDVSNYYNFEFNAIGTILDRSPLDGRSSSWNASGVVVAITIDGTLNDDADTDIGWITEIAIPFANFEGYAVNLPPLPGDEWRLNLYRIGGRTNPQFSVWSDTQTDKPQYHAPTRFGRVRFSAAGPEPTNIGVTSLGTIKRTHQQSP